MDCPSCKAQNSDDNAFCGKCAAALYPDRDSVNQRVDRILQERFRDRAIIEHEISDKLLARFMTLIKVAGWVFAPALTLFLLTVGFVGFMGLRTYSDARSAITNATATAVDEIRASATKGKETVATSAKTAQ